MNEQFVPAEPRVREPLDLTKPQIVFDANGYPTLAIAPNAHAVLHFEGGADNYIAAIDFRSSPDARLLRLVAEGDKIVVQR